MRKLLLLSAAALAVLSTGAAPAGAADMTPAPAPAYKAPPPMPPMFSWTGFYIGGNLGGAWAKNSVTDSLFGLNFSNGTNNGVFIGGGQIGGNYQFSNFVIGLEGSFDWLQTTTIP
jgi:outer membrane immunogenic protein